MLGVSYFSPGPNLRIVHNQSSSQPLVFQSQLVRLAGSVTASYNSSLRRDAISNLVANLVPSTACPCCGFTFLMWLDRPSPLAFACAASFLGMVGFA